MCFNSKTLASVASVEAGLVCTKQKQDRVLSWFCFEAGLAPYGDVLLLFIFLKKNNNPVDFHSKSVSLSLKYFK